MHDRRMEIAALCTPEPMQGEVSETTTSQMPPLIPVHQSTGTNSNSSNPLKISSSSTGKTSTKKRSRRLSNSERGKLYRSRRKNYVQTLEEQVEQLKKEVDDLTLLGKPQSYQLYRQPTGSTSFARVVNEYFSLFKYGVPVTENGVAVDNQLPRASSQAAFLKGLMHPNLVFGQTYGVQELLTQWQKYSLYHTGLKYEVKNMQIMTADPNPVVLAPATLYVRFTRRTIEKIFPHVLWYEDLVQRLIGMEFAYPVDNTFYFGDDNKIHRYDTYVDFVAAFVHALGNIQETMVMMESALIKQESMIGDLLEEPPAVNTEFQVPRVEMMESDSSDSSDGLGVLSTVGARMSLQSIMTVANETMKQMREQVKDLEQRKQRLVERAGGSNSGGLSDSIALMPSKVASPQSQESRSPTLPTSSYPSAVVPVKRDNFVQLTSEIEEFRRQNAIMINHLRERDLLTSYMQNLLMEFSKDKSDGDNNNSSGSGSDSSKGKNKYKQPLGSGPRPFNRDSSVRFTPLTREEGMACVQQTLQLINSARILYASDAHFQNRSKFLGWSQYTLRQGSTISFAVKKKLNNVTPQQLMATTWRILTDSKNVKKLISATVDTHIRPLQKLSDDLLVIDRRSEDSAHPGVGGKTLALRTVYVLFRVADADGGQTLAMKTINLPLVKKMMREDEMWCDIFYWLHFSRSGEVTSAGGNEQARDTAAVVEFGGSNTYTRDEIASVWLRELMFLAIRWETLAVAPTLLKQ
ncbi:hypothetical protein BBJ29_007317 [Phytophthora kernoviae]|uniref:BZIP domain-containing protein n=1 Tax=Phytophthora kernoviae TaxID=325452 RepID=A0A3F2RVI6_9STRA|nr:hypothetical protein BBJ29_007317 [Phytophthora kernoviae]RLN65016.1 hypothetical protein BBP00_00003097 [Phytophthora kernoviae]